MERTEYSPSPDKKILLVITHDIEDLYPTLNDLISQGYELHAEMQTSGRLANNGFPSIDCRIKE